MSNNKQSSVEWLFEQYKLIGMLTTAQFEKAQAMHNKEIRTAFRIGEKFSVDYFGGELDTDEQYYNETYGGNNEQQ